MISREVLPGVHVSRRWALQGAWAAPAMWILSRFTGASARSGLDVESFLRRWSEEAEKLAGQDAPNEDEHLHRLCAEIARFEPDAFPSRRAIVYDDRGFKSGPSYVGMPLLVIQFDLEPGAVIPAHNHVGFAFVSMGVRGEATVRHFEPQGDAPAPDELGVDFEMREVSSTVLHPGRTSALTRTRANIHWFQAGEKGATFLDFGIKFPGPGEGPTISSSVEFEDEPADRVRRVHTARWIGDIYK